MSFPNIPDIEPYINITLEDAVNLILSSIAMEEMSLSKLIDAETEKIQYVINKCRPTDSALQDALDINKSVDGTMKDIIKLQMLLQFKLENVKEILPSTSTTTTTSTSTTTTTTCTKTTTTKCSSSTTTCTTSTCSTTTKRDCACSLIGKGKGTISNPFDDFNCQTAVLQAFLLSYNTDNRTLYYTVKNDTDELYFEAASPNIEMKCPNTVNTKKIVVYGKGKVIKKMKYRPDISEFTDFKLKVIEESDEKLEYKMMIHSDVNSDLSHDSGIVQVKNSISDLKLEVCC